MARIEGIDLPRNKRVEIGLAYLYGIGLTRSRQILADTKINPDTRIKDLSEAEVSACVNIFPKFRGGRRLAPRTAIEHQAAD